MMNMHVVTSAQSLNNKAETVMQIEADKDDKSISVVEPLHIRDREFEPFAFRINDDNLPELVEFYQPQKRQNLDARPKNRSIHTKK